MYAIINSEAMDLKKSGEGLWEDFEGEKERNLVIRLQSQNILKIKNKQAPK